MNLENVMEKARQEALEILQTSEDKSGAILEAIDKVVTAKNSDLIKELKEEEARAKSDEQFAKSLNLRVLSKEETKFYENFKDIKQAITAKQVDTIPTSIIDRTLDDVKKESGVLKLVQFAPADVKKWLVAEKTGTYAWGELFGTIGGELSAEFSTLNVDLNKLSTYLIIPKAIRDLSLPFVDKYFMAILEENMIDGLEYGYLSGNGKNQPIGIYNQIAKSTDGVHTAKVLDSTLKDFTPKSLAPVKKSLSKDGKRTFDKIYLICNPADQADYVDPSIYDREGRLVSSYKNLEVIPCANNPKGKAVFTLDQKYVMGISGVKINDYDQTKALDDADVVIAKAYANGRAVDDSVAYVFDVTKLEEYIPTYQTITTAQGA